MAQSLSIFAKQIHKLASHRFDLWSVWSDFVEMAAIAISNQVDLAQREPREQRYMTRIKKYEPEQQRGFAEALGALTIELEGGIDDVLGRAFMELELGSKWAGQFFTPFALSRLMAEMLAHDIKPKLEAQRFVTASDPAVGAGSIPLALCAALQAAGVAYQDVLHVTAQDIDERAAHMAYIQLSLIGCPATIVVGDTLRMETRSVWYTPMHVVGLWAQKLAAREHVGSIDSRAQVETGRAIVGAQRATATPTSLLQLSLFEAP